MKRRRGLGCLIVLLGVLLICITLPLCIGGLVWLARDMARLEYIPWWIIPSFRAILGISGATLAFLILIVGLIILWTSYERQGTGRSGGGE